MLGAEAPQMEEQPVAFAIIMRSPNSWVITLIYGVSPQPEHAPENSKYGIANWLPLTDFLSIRLSLTSTFIAYSQLAA